MSFILHDSDVLIRVFRGAEKPRVYVKTAASDNMVGCSVVSVAKIYGDMRSYEKEKTDLLLNGLELIEVTRAIAQKAGLYKGSVKSPNVELDYCLIATTAFEMKATLAPGKGEHYPMDHIRKEIVCLIE